MRRCTPPHCAGASELPPLRPALESLFLTKPEERGHMAARRILAIGGGGFMMEGRFAPIDHELLRLTDKRRPRICVLPTPTGDAQEVLDRFYGAYDPFCNAYQLTPFRKSTERSVPLRDIA